MAAPAYIEIPLRTNKTGAGIAFTRFQESAMPTPAWCLTTENALRRVVWSYGLGRGCGIRANSA
ncbi:hypothetical protein GCM10027360_50810 [Amycolatopsis echigonensis]